MNKIISDEEEYFENMSFSYALNEFIKNTSPHRWWFKDCVQNGDVSYLVTFKSYVTPEYSKFELNVRVAILEDHTYFFETVREVTELTP